MTFALSNNAEGGSNTTTVTTGNSGGVSGDAWSTVTIGASAALTFDSSQSAHGSLSYALSTGASSVQCNLAWTLTASATVYFRAYVRTPNSFANTPSVMRFQGSGSQAMRLTWNASGNLLIRNGANTTVATSSTAMSTSTWYRVEGFCTIGASGTAEIKLWSTIDGALASPTETLTAAAQNYGTNNIDTVNFGQVATAANIPTWYLDDLWVTDFGYVGPVQQPNNTFVLPLPPWALLLRPILPWYWSRSSLVDVAAGPPGPVPFSLVSTVSGRAAVIPTPAQFIHPPLGGPAPPGPTPLPVAVPLRGYGQAAVIPARAQFVHPPLGFTPIGQPLLPGILNGRIAVEVAWGADLTDTTGASWTWTDVTADVMYEQRVSITQGRADETSQASPAACAFTLLNMAGNYTPYAPASAYYPNVRRGTPVRVRVDPGDGVPRVRFQGYAASFNPAWDPSAERATVAVSANGVLRRLTQGRTPLKSAIVRAMLDPTPIAAWPLEDESSATIGASLLSSGQPMRVTAGTVTFGADATELTGLSAVAAIADGGYIQGTVNSYTSTGFLAFSFWLKPFTTGSTCQIVFGHAKLSGGVTAIDFYAINDVTPPAGFVVFFTDSTGALWNLDSGLGSPGSPVDPFSGWHNCFVTMTVSGSDTITRLYVDGVLADTRTITGFTVGTLNSIAAQSRATIGPTGTINVAGVTAWADSTAAANYSAGTAYTGEDAATRIARLCAEQGVPVTVAGTSDTLMGPQPEATFVDLLRECETADVGLLYDGLGPGLGYICRSQRYNATASMTLDMAVDPPQVANSFDPVDDDQRNRNDVTASRSGGSSARYVDTTGNLGTNTIGTYDTSVTVNVQADSQLLDQAGWRVHLGTIEGLRYPSLSVDLLAVPSLATTWLAVPLAGRVDVVNVTSRALQHPPDDLTLAVEGWSETLGTFTWYVVQNCSPQKPWNVAVLQDATYPLVLDTAGSSLAVSVSSSDTSWQVNTTSGPLWTTDATYPADFPMDWNVGGEQVRVTALSGGSSPQTATVTRSINGVVASHAAGTDIRLWDPAVLSL